MEIFGRITSFVFAISIALLIAANLINWIRSIRKKSADLSIYLDDTEQSLREQEKFCEECSTGNKNPNCKIDELRNRVDYSKELFNDINSFIPLKFILNLISYLSGREAKRSHR